jgi:hypothetical protein
MADLNTPRISRCKTLPDDSFLRDHPNEKIGIDWRKDSIYKPEAFTLNLSDPSLAKIKFQKPVGDCGKRAESPSTIRGSTSHSRSGSFSKSNMKKI